MSLFACPQCKETFPPKIMHMNILIPGMEVPFSLLPHLKERGMAQQLCQVGPRYL